MYHKPIITHHEPPGDHEPALCDICSNVLTDEDEHPVICNQCNYRGEYEFPGVLAKVSSES